jgi:streptomycin 6-kinase
MQAALRDVAQRWQQYWPNADMTSMTADVEARLASARAAWGLSAAEPLPGGNVALTCAAGDVVVKVLPRGHPEVAQMRGEGQALEHWQPTGATVELIDRRDHGMTLLLRRLDPATTLEQATSDYDRQLLEVGALVRRLHDAGPPPRSLPGIEQHVDAFRRVPDRQLQAELVALIASSDRPVAVHADLHGGNVLLDGDRWLVIDPKGVRAERHVEIWLLVCPQAPPLPDDADAARNEMLRRLQVYSSAAGLDPTRAAAWTRVVARAESVLSGDGGCRDWPARLRRIAASLGE